MDVVKYFLALFVLLSLAQITSAFVEGLYCGVKSCYDVLGVERDAKKSQISKVCSVFGGSSKELPPEETTRFGRDTSVLLRFGPI